MTTKDESHTSGDLGIERVKQIRNPALVQERRTQILDAALELFIEKGYHRTTIRDICARSGINQASLYDYVQNKDDILRRLLYRMHHPERPESNGEPCDPASLASFEAYLIYLFEFAWTENHKAIQLTYRTAGDMARDDLGEVLDRDAALVDRVAKGIDHFYDLKADDDRVAVIANVIVGLGEQGEPKTHCHAVFMDGEGAKKGGHLIPGACIVGPGGLVAWATSGGTADLQVRHDPETNFPIFHPAGATQS